MGRKATGRNSRMVRVPLDFNVKHGIALYYEVFPILEQYFLESCKHSTDEPRWQKIKQMFEDIGLEDVREK